MKKLFSTFLAAAALSAAADNVVIQSTPFTRPLMRSTSAAEFDSQLGLVDGANAVNLAPGATYAGGLPISPIVTNLGTAATLSAPLSQLNQQNYFTNTIVCYGDSITAGGISTTNWVLTYPFFLNALGGYTTTNFSHSGWNSTAVLGLFATNQVYWKSPTIIECGVNDHTQGESASGWTNTTLQNFLTFASDLQGVGNSNYIFISIINGTNEPAGDPVGIDVSNFNVMAKSVLGSNHWFDAQAWLVANYNPSIPQDAADAANFVTPWSMRQGNYPRAQAFPWVHPNPYGQEILARGLCGTILNNWSASVVSEATLRQNLALYEMHNPVLSHATIFDQLNFVDIALGEQASMTYSNRDLQVWTPYNTAEPTMSVDGSPFGNHQFYMYGASGWIPALGYAPGGARPWQVFSTNSFLYGVTQLRYIQDITGGIIYSNIGGNAANGLGSIQPNLGTGNWWTPFLFGINYSTKNTVAFQFYYNGYQADANYWTPAWYGIAGAHKFFANGNESLNANLTNNITISAQFVGDGQSITNISPASIVHGILATNWPVANGATWTNIYGSMVIVTVAGQSSSGSSWGSFVNRSEPVPANSYSIYVYGTAAPASVTFTALPGDIFSNVFEPSAFSVVSSVIVK